MSDGGLGRTGQMYNNITMKKVCIVVPCFNEQDNVDVLYDELDKVFAASQLDVSWSIIFVDDGSLDDTAKRLRQISKRHKNTTAIILARNYGHQTALLAGLEQADGDAVISMDADLQHPPRLVPKLIELWQAGNEVVYTVRKKTEDEKVLKKLTSKVYYWLFNKMAEIKLEDGSADFRLYDRKALDALLRYKEKSLFLRGMISQLGYKQVAVDYEASKRLHGESSYSLKKMLILARDGITSFSRKPLRMAIYVGSIFALLSLIYVVYAIVLSLLGVGVHGWASLVAGIFLMGGIQLMFLGIIGEYIGQIYTEVKNRPRYNVSSVYVGGKEVV